MRRETTVVVALASRGTSLALDRGMAISILIADDHNVVIEGYRAALSPEPDFDIVGAVADGSKVTSEVHRLAPRVLLLDLSMAGAHGFDVLDALAEERHTRVVVATMYATAAHAYHALALGAAAFLTKQCPVTELVRVIREVAAGRLCLVSPASLETTLRDYEQQLGAQPNPYDALTERERAVLHSTAEGRSNAQTAVRIGISKRTVESHRINMMRKMGFESRAALYRWGVRMGFISR
jgi:DNA-binding NarL/FixJ family response regulator